MTTANDHDVVLVTTDTGTLAHLQAVGYAARMIELTGSPRLKLDDTPYRIEPVIREPMQSLPKRAKRKGKGKHKARWAP